MKLQEGVDLHFIESEQFTTNRICLRFAAEMSAQTVAGRVLVSNLIEMGNEDFPTTQAIRQRLAALYGAHFSTAVSKRGRVHYVDVMISYVSPSYLPDSQDITADIFDFLYSCLFKPLKKGRGFDTKLFDIEKNNLICFLEAEMEDHFYHADIEISKLFYQDESIKIPRVSQIDLVKKETAESTFQIYRNMLRMDKIDIFILGKVDKELVKEKLKSFGFTYRKPKLSFEYQQDFSTITKEKLIQKQTRQSILELAYHLQVIYNDVNHPALLVLNGLFGAFSNSKLFTNIREKESLAYTIGSHVSIFSGMMTVYAGINRKDKLRVMRLVSKQLLDLKYGKFTDSELELTKNMLIHSMKLSQDGQKHLIEQAYLQQLFGDRYMTWSEWIKAVNIVSREDVVKVAQLIRLQAVYFMEGTDK